MTDENGKKRPTRRSVRSDLDGLRDETRADVPEVTEVKITTVGIDLPPDERTDTAADDDTDDADDGRDRAEVAVHTRYDRDAGEWVDARDDGDTAAQDPADGDP